MSKATDFAIDANSVFIPMDTDGVLKAMEEHLNTILNKAQNWSCVLFTWQKW